MHSFNTSKLKKKKFFLDRAAVYADAVKSYISDYGAAWIWCGAYREEETASRGKDVVPEHANNHIYCRGGEEEIIND